MRTISFKCYKILPKLPLNKISSFFGISDTVRWKDSLALDSNLVSSILKKQSDSKFIFLYEYGCITFVNFESDEIDVAIQYIESISMKIDYDLYGKYNEQHVLNISDNGFFSLWSGSDKTFEFHNDIIPIVAEILAKSTALNKIETDMDILLDKNEHMITHYQRGYLPITKQKHARNISYILRFEYEVINHLQIFDRLEDTKQKQQSRQIYDLLSEYYEISDRFSIFEKKNNQMREISKTYSTRSFYNSEGGLILFEVFLLSLFPLPDVLHLSQLFKRLAHIFDFFF